MAAAKRPTRPRTGYGAGKYGKRKYGAPKKKVTALGKKLRAG